MLEKKILRKKYILVRQHLSQETKNKESQGLVKQLLKTSFYQKAQYIAVYIATKNEISLQPIIQECWKDKKKTYLPTIQNSHLLFVEYSQQTSLIKNKYNILEPQQSSSIKTSMLDLVLMPLVTIDKHGNRLGMGQGFYDKTFHFLNNKPRPKKPFLIGVSYESQNHPAIPNTPLDIPCNAILTHKTFYRCLP